MSSAATAVNSQIASGIRRADTVLIIDSHAGALSWLSRPLVEFGFTVCFEPDAESAATAVLNNPPDIILLDTRSTGEDCFETCRRLKSLSCSQHIPVIFMNAVQETEQLVSAFNAGGADYISSSICASEVIARINSHIRSSRLVRQASTALDAFGQATASVCIESGRLLWQTPLARALADEFFEPGGDSLPASVIRWIDEATAARQAGMDSLPFTLTSESKRLTFKLLYPSGEQEWLISLRKESETALIEKLEQSLKLTPRQSEVLYWVSKGKTNREIGEILGSSPRTVNKHLEHVFSKLGVETRTAAASMAINQVAGSH